MFIFGFGFQAYHRVAQSCNQHQTSHQTTSHTTSTLPEDSLTRPNADAAGRVIVARRSCVIVHHLLVARAFFLITIPWKKIITNSLYLKENKNLKKTSVGRGFM